MSKIKLNLFRDAELSKSAMKNVKGGSTPLEYCCDTLLIISLWGGPSWSTESWQQAMYAVDECFGSSGYFPSQSELDCSWVY